MLRRTTKSQSGKSRDDGKRKIVSPHVSPLDKKKLKEAVEKDLESVVLGGSVIQPEVSIANELENEVKKEQVKSKKPAWVDQEDEPQILDSMGKTPNWAALSSGKKRRTADDDDSDVEDLMQSTGSYLTAPKLLSRDILQFQPCADLNKTNPSTSKLKALEFHPSAHVALIGTANNTVTLFQVDGKTNAKIQSFFIERYPIICAHFSKDGEQVILGSKHKNFKYLDMVSGKIYNAAVKGSEETGFCHFEVSPDGKYIVLLGKHGRLQFFSSRTKEWLFGLKMNDEVSSIAFSRDGSQMYSFGDEGQVYIWDVNMRKCAYKFADDGCTRGTSLAVSPNDLYIACGSNTGIVNLYEKETCYSTFSPKPLKTVMNLSSNCDLAKFNSTSEILAIASTEDSKAVKLVHVPSQSVFSNFPDRTDVNMTTPTVMDFSVNSGYFSVGTNKGKALLYRLQHYKSY